MVECRAIISDIKEVRKRIENLEAIFDSDYSFVDIIFIPKEGNYNLDEEFLRARVYLKNNWLTKKIVLIRKKTSFQELGKVNTVTLKEEFENKEELSNFIKTREPAFTYGFEYKRDGWQYTIKEQRIFVEDIEGFSPSIEIEGNSPEEIKSLLTKIGILEIVHSSIPETMRKALHIISK